MAGSWHGRGRVMACEQRRNGMVLCESNSSIGRLETARWPPASVRLPLLLLETLYESKVFAFFLLQEGEALKQ
jgi:hypothetical protein